MEPIQAYAHVSNIRPVREPRFSGNLPLPLSARPAATLRPILISLGTRKNLAKMFSKEFIGPLQLTPATRTNGARTVVKDHRRLWLQERSA
jgi:hypothetical protein